MEYNSDFHIHWN